MNKSQKLAKALLINIFVAVETVLFVLFVVEDFAFADLGDNVALKYSTVMIATLFAGAIFTLYGRDDIKDGILLVLALVLTLVSDFFLLVLDDYYIVGLITFIGAQLCHFARIRRNTIWLISSIVARAVLSIIAIIVLAALKEANALNVLVAIYFVQLVGNFVENVVVAFTAKSRDERVSAIILSVGFLLFIGCDISVGVANVFGEAYEWEWVFYTPSQVLIALSLRRLYATENN